MTSLSKNWRRLSRWPRH